MVAASDVHPRPNSNVETYRHIMRSRVAGPPNIPIMTFPNSSHRQPFIIRQPRSGPVPQQATVGHQAGGRAFALWF